MSFFCQHMIEFVNRLELNNNKCQKNVAVRYENYRVKFVFTMKVFVSILTYHQPMFLCQTEDFNLLTFLTQLIVHIKT